MKQHLCCLSIIKSALSCAKKGFHDIRSVWAEEAACTQVDISKATNVLDRWINAAARSLTAFMRTEMAAYRLYTVVPRLVSFIEDLTNVYVRYNRKRLKGGKGREDCAMALASLYDVMLTLCKVGACPLLVLRDWRAE